MTSNSPLFRDYLTFLLKEEGGKSSNQKDSAVRCAPYLGAVHTNKGVTYCTFKSFADRLGVTPVTYDHFLRLTDGEAAKFLYLYYEGVGGPKLPDRLALALTEVGWGSGPEVAIMTLQRALNNLGNHLEVDGGLGSLTLAAVQRVNSTILYDEFWKEREKWLRSLDDWPVFGPSNWLPRIKRFVARFPPAGGAALLLLTVAAIGLWITRR